jgi:hypothetical protein
MKKIDGYIEEARTYAHSQPKLAYESAEKALKLAITYKSKSDQAQAYFFMALACRVMSDYVNGLSSALKSLDLFEISGDQLGIMKA